MGKRQKLWAKRQSEHLKAQLGNKCADCGAVEQLTLDAVDRSWPEHHGMSYDQRMSFYRRLFRQADLRVQCAACAAKQGAALAKGQHPVKRFSPVRERVMHTLRHCD